MTRKPYIDYDFRWMLREHIHESGITKRGFAAMLRDLTDAQEQVRKSAVLKGLTQGAGKQELKQIKDLAKQFKMRAKTLVVIGIGGSDLGARAIIQALDGKDVVFLSATTDPSTLHGALTNIDLTNCVINVVSKSGETIETLATFAIIEEKLSQLFGQKKLSERIIVTTGPKGALRAIAEEKNYATLPVPEHVGGRYSVFTACGMFPAAFANLPIEKIIDGAESIFSEVARGIPERSAPLLFAGLHAAAAFEERITTTVLMPYAGQLEHLGMWFRQLWAESLGKRQNRAGGAVLQGLQPIVSMGPTDQHSQLQLYLDGPNTNAVTLLAVAKPAHDFVVPKQPHAQQGTVLALIQGKKLSKLLDAEQRATARALAESGRINGTLTLQKLDAEHIGALLGFFISATVIIAELMDIDAFNQPAVERIKQHVAAYVKA